MAKSQEVRRFRNTSTGLIEEVTHEQTIVLMEDSDRYEEVTDKGEAKKSAPKKGADKDGEGDK